MTRLNLGLGALRLKLSRSSSFQTAIDQLLFAEKIESNIYHNAIIDVATALRDNIDWNDGVALSEAFECTSSGSPIRDFAIDMFLLMNSKHDVENTIEHAKNPDATKAAFRALLHGMKDAATAFSREQVCRAYHRHEKNKSCKIPSKIGPEPKGAKRSASAMTAPLPSPASVPSKRQRTILILSEGAKVCEGSFKIMEGSEDIEVQMTDSSKGESTSADEEPEAETKELDSQKHEQMLKHEEEKPQLKHDDEDDDNEASQSSQHSSGRGREKLLKPEGIEDSDESEPGDEQKEDDVSSKQSSGQGTPEDVASSKDDGSTSHDSGNASERRTKTNVEVHGRSYLWTNFA